MAEHPDDILLEVTNSDYKYGFESNFETDEAPMGLDESIIRFISDKKNERSSKTFH
jgi:Fe-S cluster assembly protein SufB